MDDSDFTEKTLRIETAAKEALKGVEELRMMMAKKHASKPPLTQSKIRLWTKKVLKHVKPGEKTACETDASTSSNSKPTIKTTGWKLRSPLSRRSPAKENPVQAAEIEKLKQAIKVIESQSSEPHEDESETLESLRAENRCLEEYKAAAARLAQEKLESQPRMTQLEAENNTLKNEKQRLEPLVQVGVAVRRRFYDTYKRATDPMSRENTDVIRNGNVAAHYGNVAADAALFFLKALDRAEYGKIFDTIYQIGMPENYHGHYLSARATDIINHRGTVEATVHYPDKTVYERFIALEKKCRETLLSVRNGPLSTVITMIDSDKNIQKHCLQMQEMAAQLCNLARRGKYSGKVPKSAKDLEKRILKEQRKLMGPEVKPTIVTEKTAIVQVTPDATEEKPKKKKKKKRAKGAVGPVMSLQALSALAEEKTTEVKVTMGNGGKLVEEVKEVEIPAVRGDIGQLGRVEIVIPSFFSAISGMFGYSR